MNYQTHDQYIGSFLLSCPEVKLVNYFRDISGDLVLEFSTLEVSKQLVLDYTNGRAKPVQPKTAYDSIRQYKQFLYETKRR